MMRWMVSIELPVGRQAEIVPLIPQERVRVQTLMKEGSIQAVYVSADSIRTWLVVHAESQRHLQRILESLPLYTYMTMTLTALAER